MRALSPSSSRGCLTHRVLRLGLLVVLLSTAYATPVTLRRQTSGVAGLHAVSSTVDANHPAVVEVAAAIRSVALTPLEQVVAVQEVTRSLIEYDRDPHLYGRADYVATLDEMLALQRRQGWLYPRDDCDGRALFAAHLLETLGLPWRLEGSRLKGHAWVAAQVAGRWYDLLDLRPLDPELQRLSYRLFGRWLVKASRPPPAFDLRQAWQVRAGGDLELGVKLGLVELAVTGDHHARQPVNWSLRRTRGSEPVDQRGLASGP